MADSYHGNSRSRRWAEKKSLKNTHVPFDENYVPVYGGVYNHVSHKIDWLQMTHENTNALLSKYVNYTDIVLIMKDANGYLITADGAHFYDSGSATALEMDYYGNMDALLRLHSRVTPRTLVILVDWYEQGKAALPNSHALRLTQNPDDFAKRVDFRTLTWLLGTKSEFQHFQLHCVGMSYASLACGAVCRQYENQDKKCARIVMIEPNLLRTGPHEYREATHAARYTAVLSSSYWYRNNIEIGDELIITRLDEGYHEVCDKTLGRGFSYRVCVTSIRRQKFCETFSMSGEVYMDALWKSPSICSLQAGIVTFAKSLDVMHPATIMRWHKNVPVVTVWSGIVSSRDYSLTSEFRSHHTQKWITKMDYSNNLNFPWIVVVTGARGCQIELYGHNGFLVKTSIINNIYFRWFAVYDHPTVIQFYSYYCSKIEANVYRPSSEYGMYHTTSMYSLELNCKNIGTPWSATYFDCYFPRPPFKANPNPRHALRDGFKESALHMPLRQCLHYYVVKMPLVKVAPVVTQKTRILDLKQYMNEYEAIQAITVSYIKDDNKKVEQIYAFGVACSAALGYLNGSEFFFLESGMLFIDFSFWFQFFKTDLAVTLYPLPPLTTPSPETTLVSTTAHLLVHTENINSTAEPNITFSSRNLLSFDAEYSGDGSGDELMPDNYDTVIVFNENTTEIDDNLVSMVEVSTNRSVYLVACEWSGFVALNDNVSCYGIGSEIICNRTKCKSMDTVSFLTKPCADSTNYCINKFGTNDLRCWDVLTMNNESCVGFHGMKAFIKQDHRRAEAVRRFAAPTYTTSAPESTIPVPEERRPTAVLHTPKHGIWVKGSTSARMSAFGNWFYLHSEEAKIAMIVAMIVYILLVVLIVSLICYCSLRRYEKRLTEDKMALIH